MEVNIYLAFQFLQYYRDDNVFCMHDTSSGTERQDWTYGGDGTGQHIGPFEERPSLRRSFYGIHSGMYNIYSLLDHFQKVIATIFFNIFSLFWNCFEREFTSLRQLLWFNSKRGFVRKTFELQLSAKMQFSTSQEPIRRILIW